MTEERDAKRARLMKERADVQAEVQEQERLAQTASTSWERIDAHRRARLIRQVVIQLDLELETLGGEQ